MPRVTFGAMIVNLCRADKVLLSGWATIVGSGMLIGPTAAGLGIPAALFVALIADGVFRPSSNTFYPTISHGPRNSNRVALTFDDGPDPVVTPQILDRLRDHGARATFFVIGRNLEQTTDVASRAVREGHEIGNHSWEHGYMRHAYPVQSQLQEMDRNEVLIRSITGQRGLSVYRPPVGLKSPNFARAAHRLALNVIAWSVHSRDTLDQNGPRIARRILSRIRGGDIVLLHDGHQRPGARRTSALAALPTLLAGLQERNLEAVTVSELLAGRLGAP